MRTTVVATRKHPIASQRHFNPPGICLIFHSIEFIMCDRPTNESIYSIANCSQRRLEKLAHKPEKVWEQKAYTVNFLREVSVGIKWSRSNLTHFGQSH
jgi:hypothetical protein